MKRAISLALSAVLLSSSVLPVSAQKRQAPKSEGLSAGTLATGKTKKAPVALPDSTRFAGFAAFTDGSGVWLSWQMEAEVGNIGFYVYRVEKNGARLLSPAKMVQGAATHGREVPAYGTSYNFYDGEGDGSSAYYVEAFGLDGVLRRTDRIYPQYVSSIESLTGLSPHQLAARGETKHPQLETSVLSFTKEIASEISANSAQPDPGTHIAVISTPGAVRIGVKNEGLHRVTRQQLEDAGFDVQSDPTMWQLYIEGIEQAIIIGPNADYIEFYGKGTDTVETDTRRYFLIKGDRPGKRMETRVAHPNTSTVVTPSYLQTFIKKERTSYLDDIINGDLENYFGRGIGNAAPTSLDVTLTGVDFSVPNATVHLKFQGYSLTAHAIAVTLNDQLLGNVPGGMGEVSFSGDFPIQTSVLREGVNTFKFQSVAVNTDFSYFDTLSIDFSRKFVAQADRLSFYTQNYRAAKLSGFTSPNVRVFDMTHPADPALMTNIPFVQDGATFGASLPASRGRAFYAVENSAILTPDSVTPNNPELIGAPTNSADLVIIAYKDFLAEAQTWANYRIAQGTPTKVIEVSEIYDEFNYGTMSSESIRSFLQQTQSWVNAPEYILLIGDTSWDSRNYEGYGSFNHIPSKFVPTLYIDTASDDALADFNGDGLTEMAIGRISVRTAAQVTTNFNKMVMWEGMTGDWFSRGAVFAYDHNNGYPFSQMSTNLRNQVPAIPSTFVYRGEPNANANLLAAMGNGPYIINYSGHGTAGSWGGLPVFFNAGTVPNIPNSNPSIYTMLTCLNGYFQWLYNPSLAELLMNTPNKGAVVAWASTGLTFPDTQELMATRFYLKLGESPANTRIGDLVRDAKTVVPGGSDVRLSWVLLGDPMLRVK